MDSNWQYRNTENFAVSNVYSAGLQWEEQHMSELKTPPDLSAG